MQSKPKHTQQLNKNIIVLNVLYTPSVFFHCGCYQMSQTTTTEKNIKATATKHTVAFSSSLPPLPPPPPLSSSTSSSSSSLFGLYQYTGRAQFSDVWKYGPRLQAQAHSMRTTNCWMCIRRELRCCEIILCVILWQ